MTREEAKEYLKEIASDLGFTGIEEYTCKDGAKMLEAIEALEQEPIEVEAAKLQEAYNKGFADGHVAENATTEQFGNSEDLGTTKKNLAVAEQEPCEDCISRQAVSEAIRKIGLCKCNTNEIEAVDECLKAVENLPSVNPQEPRKGRWIERIERDEYNDYEEEWYECDQCHIDAERPCNYCPNCGCRMEK